MAVHKGRNILFIIGAKINPEEACE